MGLRSTLCAAGKPGILNRTFARLSFPVGEAGDIALSGGGLLAVFFLFIIGDERHGIFF